MHLDCSAKGLGWLWSVKSFVEETMLINARRVALHCVEFIADVAKGTPSAAGLLEEVGKVSVLHCLFSYCYLLCMPVLWLMRTKYAQVSETPHVHQTLCV